jgi:signal-transduction protein with cAMP-binding, CBS, and nucleotidyltransferase domain
VSSRAVIRAMPAPWTRRLRIASLVLTLVALMIALLFVYRTTGGTLFLFSTFAPLLVITSIMIFLWTEVSEFRRAHKLFFIEHYPAGATIFRQGDPADCAYFIRKGAVAVVNEETLAEVTELSAGDYFGEIALVTDQPRTATIRTISPVEVAVLGKENFLNMMRLLPVAEQEILSTVHDRVSENTNHHREG